jgi:TonB family protein
MAHPRLDASSLRNRYGTHLQVGLALSLTVLLAVAYVSPSLDRKTGPTIHKQETADLRHVQSTGQAQAPPAPPAPMPPRVVPREKIADPPSVEFDPSLGLDATSNQSNGVSKRPDCGGARSLREKTYYPPAALTEGLEGHVLVEFVVGEDGDVENPTVIDGGDKILNRAALRAVQRLECTAARRKFRPVRAKMTRLVVFTLPQRMDSGAS